MILLEIIFLELVCEKALVFILTNGKCQSKSNNKNIFFKVKKKLTLCSCQRKYTSLQVQVSDVKCPFLDLVV